MITMNSTTCVDPDPYTITLSSTVGATGSVVPPITWGTSTSLNNNTVYTTNGTNSGWANISLADPDIKGATLKVNGDADFDGEVTIKGKNLTDMLEKIEERLAILHPNPKLEDKWDELKELGKRYKELEAEIIEKEAMWAILKR
jgi:hypothetical protein